MLVSVSLKDPSTIRHLFLFQPEVGIFCCLYHGLGTREHQVSSSNNKNKFRQMPHDTKRPFSQNNCPSLKSWGENWSAWHEHPMLCDCLLPCSQTDSAVKEELFCCHYSTGDTNYKVLISGCVGQPSHRTVHLTPICLQKFITIEGN